MVSYIVYVVYKRRFNQCLNPTILKISPLKHQNKLILIALDQQETAIHNKAVRINVLFFKIVRTIKLHSKFTLLKEI